jgi:hypothetical protein
MMRSGIVRDLVQSNTLADGEKGKNGLPDQVEIRTGLRFFQTFRLPMFCRLS